MNYQRPHIWRGWRYWLSFVLVSWRVRKSLRAAIYAVNHGVDQKGRHYRQFRCLTWLEKTP